MNLEKRKKAVEIMNKAYKDLWTEHLTSEEIAEILEEYAKNERWQIKEDGRKW